MTAELDSSKLDPSATLNSMHIMPCLGGPQIHPKEAALPGPITWTSEWAQSDKRFSPNDFIVRPADCIPTNRPPALDELAQTPNSASGLRDDIAMLRRESIFTLEQLLSKWDQLEITDTLREALRTLRVIDDQDVFLVD